MSDHQPDAASKGVGDVVNDGSKFRMFHIHKLQWLMSASHQDQTLISYVRRLEAGGWLPALWSLLLVGRVGTLDGTLLYDQQSKCMFAIQRPIAELRTGNGCISE